MPANNISGKRISPKIVTANDVSAKNANRKNIRTSNLSAKAVSLLALALGIVPLAHVAAHHSPAMLYDLTKEITVEGVVTEYQLGNPHMRIYFDVVKDGQTEKWLAEGGSRTQLMRVGWNGEEVKPGDKIVVRGHPSRSGQKLVHMEYLTLPDGTERFAEDIDFGSFNDRRRRPQ